MADSSSWTYGNVGEVLDAVQRGDITPYEAQTWLSQQAKGWDDDFGWDDVFSGASNPYKMSPEQEKTFNNLLSRYLSQHETTWQADQLQQLGLSNAGVLQTGGVHTAADMSNIAQRDKEMKFERATGLAKSLIGLAGSLGSAGVHGAALGIVRGAAGQAATLAAHNATPLIKKYTTYYY